MKKILVVLAVAALFCAPAMAQSFNYVFSAGNIVTALDDPILIPTSLQYEASFGLLLNSQDYALNPADLALITSDESTRSLGVVSERSGDPAIVYSNLSNIGIKNRAGLRYRGGGPEFSGIIDESDGSLGVFQLGGIFAAGPGNFAGAIGYSTYSDEYTDPDGDFREEFEEDDILFLGSYGWQLADTMSLGFSLSYFDTSSEETFDDEFFGNESYQFEGTKTKLAGAFRNDISDEFSFNVMAYIGQEEGEDTFNGSNFFDFDGIELDGTTYGVQGRLNFYPRQDTDVEVFGGYHSGDYDVDNDVLLDTPSFQWVKQGDSIESTSYNLGVKVLHRFANADVGAGFVMDWQDWEYKLSYDQIEDEDGFRSASVRESLEPEIFSWSIPLTARYHFSEKFALIVGAAFVQQSIETDYDVNVDSFSTGGGGGTGTLVDLDLDEGSTEKITQTFTEYRIGFRYELSEHIAAQLLFSDDDDDRDSTSTLVRREQIETESLAASVTVSF